jgi:tetratricopeptide (TPR) repeat protein
MRTIIILCSLLALVAGCSGAKTAPAQAPPPATQGGQGLDRPRGGDAIAAYREAIRRNPNDAELHYHLGVAYAKEGRLEQAIASYRQAIALEPQYAEANEGLGLAYDRSGQAEKAAAAAREAGRLKAEYAELHYHLGLAPIQAASGALLAYATAPGMTAEDGPGRNGTYTKHLLSFIQVPRLSAEEMFKEVRVAVARETGKRQIPWVSTSLLGDFYFAGR